MIEKMDRGSGRSVGFTLSGTLHDEDYETFVPEVESVIESEGTVRILCRFQDFHGWDMHALWDDIKFATKHSKDVERIALVGETKWQEWMAKVCKPFTKASVRYFDSGHVDEAWNWIDEPV
jgi:hypothetical protein